MFDWEITKIFMCIKYLYVYVGIKCCYLKLLNKIVMHKEMFLQMS
jgi:hypothetical protein